VADWAAHDSAYLPSVNEAKLHANHGGDKSYKQADDIRGYTGADIQPEQFAIKVDNAFHSF